MRFNIRLIVSLCCPKFSDTVQDTSVLNNLKHLFCKPYSVYYILPVSMKVIVPSNYQIWGKSNILKVFFFQLLFCRAIDAAKVIFPQANRLCLREKIGGMNENCKSRFDHQTQFQRFLSNMINDYSIHARKQTNSLNLVARTELYQNHWELERWHPAAKYY